MTDSNSAHVRKAEDVVDPASADDTQHTNRSDERDSNNDSTDGVATPVAPSSQVAGDIPLPAREQILGRSIDEDMSDIVVDPTGGNNSGGTSAVDYYTSPAGRPETTMAGTSGSGGVLTAPHASQVPGPVAEQLVPGEPATTPPPAPGAVAKAAGVKHGNYGDPRVSRMFNSEPEPDPAQATPVADETEEELEQSYPEEGTVDEVVAWVGESERRRRFALDAEKDFEDPRSTLFRALHAEDEDPEQNKPQND